MVEAGAKKQFLEMILEQDVSEANTYKFVHENPDDVFAWKVGCLLSKNSMLKNYYVEQMKECVRRTGGVMNYLKAIVSTHDVGCKEENREMAKEMLEKYPVSGRALKIMWHVSPVGWFYNVFD